MALPSPMGQEFKRNGYDIIKRLHTGHESQIWKVKKNDTAYAVKIVAKRDGGETLALRDRDILRELEGQENILSVIDTVITTDQLGLVLEYCSDRNLNDFIVKKSQETVHPTLVRQILNAIQHVHEHGIAHLNIQPSNFLVHHDREGRMILKLSGFGQRARYIDQVMADNNDEGFDDSETNSFSPPPHVDRDGRPTPLTAVDIYAVGATLYALYDGTHTDGRLVAEYKGRPIRDVDEAELGRHIRKTVKDTTLQTVITDLLIKNPHSRPTVDDVVDQFQTDEKNKEKVRMDENKKTRNVVLGMVIATIVIGIVTIIKPSLV